MSGLESQGIKSNIDSQHIDLAAKIKNIYDKVDRYTSKRGNEQEAIDIINSDLLFSEDSLFASWENGVLELKEIILKDGQMEGDFHLQMRNHLPKSAIELIKEYIEFIEINYQIQLNVQDINALTKQVTNIIDGFVMANENDYKIDLGENSLIAMAGWEDISLNSREKKLYIKGTLLKFEDDSDFITRVSKKDDIYTLFGKDGSEARLSIRSTRLVLELDFLYTTKLPLYVQALDEYLLEEYRVKFDLVEDKIAETVEEEKKMVRKSLSKILTQENLFGLFKKENWYEESLESKTTREDKDLEMRSTETIWSRTVSADKILERKEKQSQNKETIGEDMRGVAFGFDDTENEDELFGFAAEVHGNVFQEGELKFLDDPLDENNPLDEKELLNKQKIVIENKVEDKQLGIIIIKCLEHIDKKKYTIENYKKRVKNSNSKQEKLRELAQITTYILDINLLEIYRYFKRYLGQNEGNLAYLKNIIRNKLDINIIGLNHYFNCGSDVKVYKTHDDESNHDIGYSSNGLYIHASVQRNIRMTHNTQSDLEDAKKVVSRPLRRYSRDGDYMMMSKTETEKGETRGIYEYNVHHLDSSKTFLDVKLKRKEKLSLTRRCVYDIVDNYLLVIGDEKLRVIAIDEDRKKDFIVSVDSENYTIATESKNLFVYSNKKLELFCLSDKKDIKTINFSDFLGARTEVLYMHARKGQVKIIYMQDGKLHYSYYNESDLVENIAYANPITSGLLDTAGFTKPFKNYDISTVNNIDLSSKIQGAELFFSEDNKYAIFVKNNTIYTIKFTKYGVKLFTTDAIGLNHVFRVKYSPDETHAILRDGSSIYKLDLEIIDELQTDDNLEEKLELLNNRRDLVTVIQSIHNKELNIQMDKENRELKEEKGDDTALNDMDVYPIESELEEEFEEFYELYSQ